MERHVDSTRSIVVIVLDKYQLAPAGLHAERGHEGIRHDHQGRRHAERGGHGHHQP